MERGVARGGPLMIGRSRTDMGYLAGQVTNPKIQKKHREGPEDSSIYQYSSPRFSLHKRTETKGG